MIAWSMTFINVEQFMLEIFYHGFHSVFRVLLKQKLVHSSRCACYLDRNHKGITFMITTVNTEWNIPSSHPRCDSDRLCNLVSQNMTR